MHYIKCLLCATFFLFSSQAYSQSPDSNCPLTAKSMAVGGGVISYLDGGKGEPILLLHGLFAQKEQWLEVGCALALSGHHVIAPDLPGYGSSVGFAVTVYPLEVQVNTLHEFLLNMKIRSMHIAGSSMGGAIAALYVSRYPNESKSLAFIGAPLGVVGWSPQVKQAIFNGINPFIPMNLDQFNLEMSLLFYQAPKIEPTVSDTLIKEYVDNNLHYQQVWNIVNFYEDMLLRKQTYRGRVLALWGDQDGIFNIAGLPILRQSFPQAHIISLPQASHLIMLDQPKRVASIYLDFLSK